jgi:hypothetical protein
MLNNYQTVVSIYICIKIQLLIHKVTHTYISLSTCHFKDFQP